MRKSDRLHFEDPWPVLARARAIRYDLRTMTEICLIRHGQTDWNAQALIQGVTDVPLNETGRAQARGTGAMLLTDGEHWDAIWASPLSRAYETAHILAELLAIGPIRRDTELQERNFGDAEGLNAEERRARFGSGPIPGAETWDDVLQRGLGILEKIHRTHSGHRVLVVSHGGVINGLMGYLSGGDIGPGKTIIQNASANLIARVDREDGAPGTGPDPAWRILWYNRTGEAPHAGKHEGPRVPSSA